MLRILAALAWAMAFIATARSQSQPVPATDSVFASYLHLTQSLNRYEREKGQQELRRIGEWALRTGNDSAASRYYLEIASSFISLRHDDSALHYYKKALSLAKISGSKREMGNTHLAVATYYQYKGNTLVAARHLLEAVGYLRDLGRRRALIGIYQNLQTISLRLQNKNESLRSMLEAVLNEKAGEQDLVRILNASGSEQTGYSFPDQALVKEAGRDAIYVIFGNAKFVIRSFEDMQHYGSMRDIQRIPPGALELIPDFPRNGSVLREMNKAHIWVALDGKLHQITSFEVLETYGGWDAVYFVPNNAMDSFPRSDVQVTMENRYGFFNYGQEFDLLVDTISVALHQNAALSDALGIALADRNTSLQRRKTFLWVSVVGMAGLLLIVLLLFRNARQKQRLNAQRLQALQYEEDAKRKMAIERERTRIASDMHDDLGAGLSRIRFLSETMALKKQKREAVEEEITGIRHYSHEMIDKMGEIVWALNEKNDTLEDLLAYIRSYAVEYLGTHGIGVQTEFPTELPGLFVSGEFRRNFFLCMKEALHNIVKHADAARVVIRCEVGMLLRLRIADDGKGIGASPGRRGGNGFLNMKRRMEDLEGSFTSREGSPGLELVFEAPLPV